MSPLRSLVQDENVSSEETEIKRSLLDGGEGKEQDGSWVLSGAMAEKEQAVFIWKVPWEWKKDERQKASKAPKDHQQNDGPDRGLYSHSCHHPIDLAKSTRTKDPWKKTVFGPKLH